MPFRETTSTDLITKNLGFGIDITTYCNLDCIICYYMNSTGNNLDFCNFNISTEHFKKAMKLVSLAGFQEIYILGGEPTVHPRILDFLKCAGSFNFDQVLLVTNGMLLADMDFCRQIEATGTDIVVKRHVIGNGEIENKIQDTLVGRKGTLETVNRAFANIESVFTPERVAVQCCITRPVIESGQLYEIFRYARAQKFGHVIECTKASERFKRGNHWDISARELFQVYERLQRIDVEEFDGIPHQLTPQAYGKTCHMPENSVHCLIDGTIIPCVGQPFPLGNIFNDENASLDDILDSPHRDFFRAPTKRLHGHCAKCSFLTTCTGGCRGDAFFLTGCFNASAVQCPQLGNYAEKLSLKDFIPSTCHECKLQQHPVCGFRKDVNETLFRYFGSIYQENETD